VERLGRVREDWGKREVYGSEAFFMSATYFKSVIANNRKQHEFFEAIVLAHEMTAALRRISVPSSPTA
jgi:hypothetical protein